MDCKMQLMGLQLSEGIVLVIDYSKYNLDGFKKSESRKTSKSRKNLNPRLGLFLPD